MVLRTSMRTENILKFLDKRFSQDTTKPYFSRVEL